MYSWTESQRCTTKTYFTYSVNCCWQSFPYAMWGLARTFSKQFSLRAKLQGGCKSLWPTHLITEACVCVIFFDIWTPAVWAKQSCRTNREKQFPNAQICMCMHRNMHIKNMIVCAHTLAHTNSWVSVFTGCSPSEEGSLRIHCGITEYTFL